MGSIVRPGDPDLPPARGLQAQTGPIAGSSRDAEADKADKDSAFARAAVSFPEIVPPSAESLMADAPPEVLEAELKRLFGDWITGLDVLADVFDSTLAGGLGGRGGAGGSGSGRGRGGRNGGNRGGRNR